MQFPNLHIVVGSVVISIFVLLVGEAPATAAMPEGELSRVVTARYHVQVLKVLPAKELGENIVAVRVMNPPGNSNGALQVYTFFVNAETGEMEPIYGNLVSRLNRTSPLIWQRTEPFTVDD